MVNTKLTIDGTTYDVMLEFGSMQRSFEVVQGPNVGVGIPGNEIQDILGTSYSYSVRILPRLLRPQDYDSLWHKLSAPVESHSVTFPYGQTTMSFNAKVVSGSDAFQGVFGSKNRWGGMTIEFIPVQPQRTSV